MWKFLLLVSIGLIWMRIYLLMGYYGEILANLKRQSEVKQTGRQAAFSFKNHKHIPQNDMGSQ